MLLVSLPRAKGVDASSDVVRKFGSTSARTNRMSTATVSTQLASAMA